MLDDMGRKRQERRFASHAKSKQIETLEQSFGTSIERLKICFPSHRALSLLPDLPRCVEVSDLEDIGVYALLVRQTIEVAQLPRYVATIRKVREEKSWQHYEKGDLHTLLRHDEALAGVNMQLLTNDVDLVYRLATGGFNPPCPWVAFYELGPFAGSMQGSADYWYSHIWDRYWEGLNLTEQTEFLEGQRRETAGYMSAEEWQDWIDGLRFRDPGTRDSLSSNGA